ncbi:MAG: hypothetical protein ACYCU8_00520 [Ferrimicrobium acidiphilum]
MDSGSVVLDKLREKIEEAELRLSDAKRRAATLRLAYVEVKELIVGVTGPTPRIGEAVTIIMSESPRIWTIPDLEAALAERGWSLYGADPNGALRGALCRLKKAGIIEPAKYGSYRIVQNR